MKFSPDVGHINSVDFRPYIVECAHDYYIVSNESPHQKMGVQCVMSALAIEVLLKSFNSEVARNEGRLNEKYRFDSSALPKGANSHNLSVLVGALPEEIAKYLFSSSDLDVIEKEKDLFTSSRYVYEPEAKITHHDGIIKLAAKLICKVVYLYKQQGCDDPFIENFDVENLYFTHVQRFLIVNP